MLAPTATTKGLIKAIGDVERPGAVGTPAAEHKRRQVCSHGRAVHRQVEPAGQRQLNDPRVQQMIRETLINRKDQLLKAVYYEVARNEAKVLNHYARSLFERAGGGGK